MKEGEAYQKAQKNACCEKRSWSTGGWRRRTREPTRSLFRSLTTSQTPGFLVSRRDADGHHFHFFERSLRVCNSIARQELSLQRRCVIATDQRLPLWRLVRRSDNSLFCTPSLQRKRIGAPLVFWHFLLFFHHLRYRVRVRYQWQTTDIAPSAFISTTSYVESPLLPNF